MDLRALRIALQFGFGVAPWRWFRDFDVQDSSFFGLRGIVVSISQMEMDGFAFPRRVELRESVEWSVPVFGYWHIWWGWNFNSHTMKHALRIFAATALITLFSGCGFLLFLLEEQAPCEVVLNYSWRNNLLSVPVIEGTLRNTSSSSISEINLEVQTFNSSNECIYSGCISIRKDIAPYQCAPFKEWISGSEEACDVRVRVVSFE